MSMKTDVASLIEAAESLTPAAVAAEVESLTGARVRSANLAPGGKSANVPLPLPDSVDRWVTREYAEYRKAIAAALRGVLKALRHQDALLVCLHDRSGPGGTSGAPSDGARELAAAAVGPTGVECANCGVVIDKAAGQKVLDDRCRACFDYRKTHDGVERPSEMWVKS